MSWATMPRRDRLNLAQRHASIIAASARSHLDLASETTGRRRDRHLRDAIAFQLRSAELYDEARGDYRGDQAATP